MRDRLIRYTTLNDPERPNLLSTFDAERNLQQIDRYLAEILTKDMRQHLEMSEREFTMIIDDGLGLRFGDYGVTPKVMLQ